MRGWRIATLLSLIFVLGLVRCGDDDDDTGRTAAAVDTTERYCELSAGLDEAGEDIFRELEADPQATAEDFRRAEAEFVRRYEDELNAVAEAAPEEIAEDAAVLVESVRARAGLTGQPPDEQAAAQAEQAVNRFEKENCPK
jgi:hypothetical protein